MQLPDPRDFGWHLKTFDDAHSTVTHLPDGRTLFEVDHPPVREVTAEMLEWWYSVYADLTLVIDGTPYPAFLVSHPSDHISLKIVKGEQGRPLQPRDCLHIVEAYGRNPKYLLNETIEVVALETNRYALKASRRGITVADMEFRFSDGPDGVVFTNHLTVGVESGFLKALVNRVMIPWIYNEDKNYAWVLHSVEEIGNFENFLPEVFARRDQGMTITWDRNARRATDSEGPEE